MQTLDGAGVDSSEFFLSRLKVTLGFLPVFSPELSGHSSLGQRDDSERTNRYTHFECR